MSRFIASAEVLTRSSHKKYRCEPTRLLAPADEHLLEDADHEITRFYFDAGYELSRSWLSVCEAE